MGYNRFDPGCGCCGKCLIFEDYLPWAYADDAAREAAGWTGADGLWQHPGKLPKDNWQIVSFDAPLQMGVWEIQPATPETPTVVAFEIRGAESNTLLARVASVWITNDSGDSPGLRVTIEDRDYDFVYLAEHTLLPAAPGEWGDFDADTLRFGTSHSAARPTFCRLAKRDGSVYVEFLRRPSVSFAREHYIPDVLPCHAESVVYQSPPILDVAVPIVIDATGEAAMAIPLLSNWDEAFRVSFSLDIKGHETSGAPRRVPLSNNVSSRVFATRVGVHGDPLDAEVSGQISYQAGSITPLLGVRCANPGYVAAMPPHNELPTWVASLSGFDDCGVHRRHTMHSHGSWYGDGIDSEPGYQSAATRIDSVVYRLSTIYRPRYGGFAQGSNLLSDHPSLFHPDASGLAGFNVVSVWVDDLTLAELPFPDVERDYSGPVSIRRAHISTTVERSADDDYVDVVTTVDLIGDAQDSPEVLIQWRPFWFHNLSESFPGPYRILAADRGIAPLGDQYRSYQQLHYRKTVPRWAGQAPPVTLTAADLQGTSSGIPGSEDEPVYWMNEYHWSGLNGTYILLQTGPWGPWRVWWDETVRTRGVNVAALLQIHLTPTSFRP